VTLGWKLAIVFGAFLAILTVVVLTISVIL